MADEGAMAPGARRENLALWQERLHRAARDATFAPDGDRDGLVLSAMGHSVRELDLPIALFDDLISAFSQDTMTPRYASWRDLLDYCRRSANPIGRLVLRIAGYRDESLDRSSDALCTALQLTNFWQDFGRDWRNGRLYVPTEVVDARGASERDLGDRPLNDAWAQAIDDCVTFTRSYFARGREVCDLVRGRLRVELRFTWLGGMRVLDRVHQGRFDAFRRRPALGAADVPALAWRALVWRRGALPSAEARRA